jgi:hypothetical protein
MLAMELESKRLASMYSVVVRTIQAETQRKISYAVCIV